MGIIVNKSDFVGVYQVAQDSYTGTILDSVINRNEKKLLIQLLGKELFDLFQADLVGGVPQSQIYIDIYNEINITYSGCELSSLGMKEYLLGQIYLLYLREIGIKKTTNGAVKAKYESSEVLDGQGYLARLRHNDSIEYGETIQTYIMLNLSDYPTYNGQGLQYMSML